MKSLDVEELRHIPPEWDAYVERNPRGSIFHHSLWFESMGDHIDRVAAFILKRGETIYGGIVLYTHRIKWLGSIGTSPGGPLLDPGFDCDEKTIEMLLHKVNAWCLKQGVLSLDIYCRMPIQAASEGDPSVQVPAIQALIRAKYHQCAPLGTYIQRIDMADAELLVSFKEKTRGCVRQAQRRGVTVLAEPDPEELKSFFKCYVKMCENKKLSPQPERIVVDGMSRIMRCGKMLIFIAKDKDIVLNYAVVSLIGLPRYIFGAPGLALETGSFPPGGQILHYEIMRFLRDAGYSHYDWGGSPGPVPEDSHPNYGVWSFKYRFGGDYQWQVGHWANVFDPFRKGLLLSMIALSSKIRSWLKPS